LFPPKPKPEEAWRRDYPAEPADLPPPAPPEPEAEALRVSLVDILRQKHAEGSLRWVNSTMQQPR